MIKYVYERLGDKFEKKEEEKSCNTDVEAVDIAADGSWIFAICYSSDNLLFRFNQQVELYESWQEINESSISWTGSISDDHQTLIIGCHSFLDTYEFDETTNIFTYAYSLEEPNGIVYQIELSSSNDYIIASAQYSMQIYYLNGTRYTQIQSFSFTFAIQRRASMSSDGNYLFVNDKVNSKFTVNLYKFNEEQGLF